MGSVLTTEDPVYRVYMWWPYPRIQSTFTGQSALIPGFLLYRNMYVRTVYTKMSPYYRGLYNT
jgi:hypothetical protein